MKEGYTRLVRIDAKLHVKLKVLAAHAGKSMIQVLNEVCAKFFEEKEHNGPTLGV